MQARKVSKRSQIRLKGQRPLTAVKRVRSLSAPALIALRTDAHDVVGVASRFLPKRWSMSATRRQPDTESTTSPSNDTLETKAATSGETCLRSDSPR